MNRIVRTIIVFFTAVASVLPSQAVLKEKNLQQTLRVLETELQSYYADVRQARRHDHELAEDISRQLAVFGEEADQISLMVYSQQEDFVFDISYACRQAWDLRVAFYDAHFPFDSIAQGQMLELQRYQRLTEKLDELRQRADSTHMPDIERCYIFSRQIHDQLQLGQDHLLEQKIAYENVEQQILLLDSCASAHYNEVLEKVVYQPTTSVGCLLMHLPEHMVQLRNQVNAKYSFDNAVRSQWDLKNILIIFSGVLLYALLALGLGLLLNRFFIRRKQRLADAFRSPLYAVMLVAEVAFCLFSLVMHFAVDHHFIRMASTLLYQYAAVLVLLTLGLMRRYDFKATHGSLRVYAPMMALCFMVIIIRTIFLPVSLISILFPVLALAGTIWQWLALYHVRCLPKSDKILGWVTFVVMAVVLTLSLFGLSMFSLMLVMLWTLQMVSMLLFSCVKDVCERKEKENQSHGRNQLKNNWLLEFVTRLLVPVFYAISILWSIAWASDIFDLGDYIYPQMKTPFISVPDVIEVSLWTLMAITVGFFCCRYITYIAGELLRKHFLDGHHDNGAGAVVIGKNGVSILVWGTFIVSSMMSLKMGSTWIMVVTGGLSTGVGFAMKDTLENLFYGISLMLGRIHINDLIECDGVRGNVINISYQITTIQTWDGSEIAILNSQLVSKNFKNLTRNHKYEYQVIPFSVAYGTDVQHVRECLMETLSQLDAIARKSELDVRFENFGDSSVDLKVMAWVDVNNRNQAVGIIKETIYNTLNTNHIEIPFPQLDIHQR